MTDLSVSFFCMLFCRWCCWHAVRATVATPPALTPSSPSAQSSNSHSRAPAPAAGHTPPNWKRWGCAVVAGLASQPLTDTYSPATVRSAAEQTAAPSQTHKTLSIQHFSWRRTSLYSDDCWLGQLPQRWVTTLWEWRIEGIRPPHMLLEIDLNPDTTCYTLSIMLCFQSWQFMQNIPL